jgi:hypothetical protein
MAVPDRWVVVAAGVAACEEAAAGRAVADSTFPDAAEASRFKAPPRFEDW